MALPDQILAFIEQQATAAGFSTASEYVYQLILREQERLAQQRRVELMLLDGLESGEPVEATDDWWEQKRVRLERMHQPEA